MESLPRLVIKHEWCQNKKQRFSLYQRLFSMAYLRPTNLHQQKDRKLVSLGVFPVLPIAIIQNTEKKVFKTPKIFYSKYRKYFIQNTENGWLLFYLQIKYE